MTHMELFNLRKSYNPDLTIGQEIERTKNEIDFGLSDFNQNSDNWDSVKVAEWMDIMTKKKEYRKFLNQLFDKYAKS